MNPLSFLGNRQSKFSKWQFNFFNFFNFILHNKLTPKSLGGATGNILKNEKYVQACIGSSGVSLLARVRIKMRVTFQTKLKLNLTKLKLN
jgi:hypothetical protein